MPAYVYPSITLPRKNAKNGVVSEPQVIFSEHLKYTVRYWVYTPPGYDTLENLPVMYVTDGQEYLSPEMGALPIVLDNLIADNAIHPIVAVFLDPRDPQTGQNRRGTELLTNDRYETFLIRELIPNIETEYRVGRKTEDRAFLGASLAGLRGTWAIMQYPQVWGMAGIQSPYFKAKPRVLAQFAEARRLPVRVFVNQGTYDLDVEGTRHFRDVLKAKGYDYRYIETNDGHSYGNWRGLLDDMLIFFFGL
jgi:enterochelin esterase-like enzyme